MTAKTDNARTEEAMRRRALEKRGARGECSTCGRPTMMPMPVTCSCGFSTLCSHCANGHQCTRTGGELP